MKDKQQLNGALAAADDVGEIHSMKETVVNGKNNNSSHSDHNHVQHRRPMHNDAGTAQYEAQGPTESTGESLDSMPSRRELFLDPANICTLIGAMLSTLAMAMMWKKSYDVGIVLNMAANLADILDGPIARSLPKRHPSLSMIGSKLDTYSDMVSHFVVPASLLMQMSSLDLLYVGLATIWVMTGIVRQSYFEVIERCDNGDCIFGVTSDYMPPLFALSLHLLPIVGPSGMANWVLPALAGCTLFMIYGSLTLSMKTRRYGGLGLLTVTLYNLSLCLTIAIMVARGTFNIATPLGFWSFEGLSLVVHLMLAYPCYFRFIELNLPLQA
ncbi:hypothetical protein CAPTEDRAFT_222024 [Capitella teleta]|uniref:CDP-diacylglycerol--serine O-phosphatidyltransferase n=1 Tax=Capitella teleta TaxID=283909 RepID=R7U8M1_CAPTE|nr:hypothetical protein CAPTEDRAFT_222024 [Capitella teleta]|eukprot:ELU00047.1 hypothetical protein CAPTEDRAFT_222024 [Capitella teleta]